MDQHNPDVRIATNIADIVDQLRVKGNEAFKNKEFKKAAKLYRDGLKFDPENMTLYANRAMAFIKLGEYQRALNDCDKGMYRVRHDTQSFIKLCYRKSVASVALDLIDTAFEGIEKGLEQYPDNTVLQDELKRLEQLWTKKYPGKERIRGPGIPKADRITASGAKLPAEMITDIEIEVLDALPDEFQLDKPKKNLDNDEMDLELELMSITGVTVPDKKAKCTQTKHNNTESQTKSIFDEDNKFPKNPSLSLLSSLNRKPESERVEFRDYVLLLKPSAYEPLFITAGVDSEFLTFYVDSIINYLRKEEEGTNNVVLNNIIENLELFTKLPRFNLASMFISTSKVNELFGLLKNKTSKDLRSLWK